MPTSLVLASASPRRQELLQSLDLSFTCRPADVDETPLPGEDPAGYVSRLALAKASTTAHDGETVLAADTIVVLDGQLLGKPVDAEEARRMLRALSGKRHEVLTGVAVYAPPAAPQIATCRTRVTIASMSSREISWYVGTGEPLDKAGAYAIQGLGALFVTRVEGNYSNVVGLPMATVYRLFHEAGFNLLDFRS